ncbi:hypothetical protein GYMLUDRAFT_261495 [Collybiopsis luxurians FD-317 M1]|uniref:Unplaced genomic scaffold GYMLUscaffold_27, whole genome shotgun sequence n=1 Tax=Collybiopsis luxurians FD-317 M1 TaxID=944289 RepID=A0A0D0BA30_9AGAR|nr:hypothetical protein GYMLUDRAFT_261495 [Collybiopsis luxurians FD-317 M1]
MVLHRFLHVLIVGAIFALELTNDPAATDKFLVIVPLTMLPVDLTALIQLMSASPAAGDDYTNLKLGLSMGKFVAVEKGKMTEKAQLEAEKAQLKDNSIAGLPIVTFALVPYEDDEEEAAQINQGTVHFFSALPIPQLYLDEVRKGMKIQTA